MNLIDTHAHLNEIEDVEAALHRARRAGVSKIVAIGMDLESNRRTLELAARFPGDVYAAIGYHPWSIEAEQVDANLAFIEENLPHCVALGEIGLDYRAKAKKPLQWEVLAQLLPIAKASGLPVILHCRFSHERTLRMTQEAGVEQAVFHWYSGSIEVLDNIIAAGYHISATPALLYSPHHQAAVKHAPIERILIETDAPVEYQGQATGPADVLLTLRELAKIKDMDEAEAAERTSANAKDFFRI